MAILKRRFGSLITFFIIGTLMKLINIISMSWLEILGLSIVFYLIYCLLDWVKTPRHKKE